MNMDTDLRILVIILSTFLALVLLLSIIVLILFIRVMSHLRHIMQKAELVADKVEHIGAFFEKTAGPVAIMKIISNVVANVTGSHTKSRKRKEYDE